MGEDNFTIDFIGIGAPKAATTWLFKCLKEHPQICGSSQKETNFFNKQDRYARGFDYYKNFFDHCSTNQKKGEFTVFYFQEPKAAKRIAETFPGIKLILSFRDPRERAYSHYRWAKNIKARMGNYRNFKEAIKKNRELREMGMYGKHLKEWLQYFSKDQFLILLFEDIRKSPKRALKETYDFLEVKPIDFCPQIIDTKQNPTGKRKAEAKFPLINKIGFRIWEAVKPNPYFRKLVSKTYLRQLGRRTLRKNIQSKENGKKDSTSFESLDEETRKMLDKIYRSDINKLEDLINKDLSHWLS